MSGEPSNTRPRARARAECNGVGAALLAEIQSPAGRFVRCRRFVLWVALRGREYLRVAEVSSEEASAFGGELSREVLEAAVEHRATAAPTEITKPEGPLPLRREDLQAQGVRQALRTSASERRAFRSSSGGGPGFERQARRGL